MDAIPGKGPKAEKRLRWILAAFASLLLAFAAGFLLRSSWLFDWPVTATSLSPDMAWRVTLAERPAFIDRNFELHLEDMRTKQIRIVLVSGDEGRPTGSERIVWSADSSRFLVLGRRFYALQGAPLASGEQLYAMMDVRSGKIWSNSGTHRDMPRFALHEVRAIQWFAWTPG